MYNKILVALDGSEHALKALHTAIALSLRCEAELLLFHALQLRVLRPDYEVTMVTSNARQVYSKLAREQAEDIVQKGLYAAKDADLKAVTSMIREGRPARTIIEVVKEENIELLVIGTRGLTGLREITMGSVAHKVTVASPCPVLIVK
ncbi:MAG TPA: universal stress protein [Gammaproteobacteria bacterium]|nr:universal stress protein [Gammaproteobacteria bacterium]